MNAIRARLGPIRRLRGAVRRVARGVHRGDLPRGTFLDGRQAVDGYVLEDGGQTVCFLPCVGRVGPGRVGGCRFQMLLSVGGVGCSLIGVSCGCERRPFSRQRRIEVRSAGLDRTSASRHLRCDACTLRGSSDVPGSPARGLMSEFGGSVLWRHDTPAFRRQTACSVGAVDWTVSVDSTINRAHQHAAGARKKGRQRGTNWKIRHTRRLARRWAGPAAG